MPIKIAPKSSFVVLLNERCHLKKCSVPVQHEHSTCSVSEKALSLPAENSMYGFCTAPLTQNLKFSGFLLRGSRKSQKFSKIT